MSNNLVLEFLVPSLAIIPVHRSSMIQRGQPDDENVYETLVGKEKKGGAGCFCKFGIRCFFIASYFFRNKKVCVCAYTHRYVCAALVGGKNSGLPVFATFAPSLGLSILQEREHGEIMRRGKDRAKQTGKTRSSGTQSDKENKARKEIFVS